MRAPVLTLLFAALSLSTVASAETAKPSADAVRDTWNYFYKGQGQGPILVEAKLCSEVAKEGPDRFECMVEVSPASGVKAGATLFLWQAYLVPQGDAIEDLKVETKLGSTVTESKDVRVKGEGWRARQWTALRLDKPGAWTVSVVHGKQTLKEIRVEVK